VRTAAGCGPAGQLFFARFHGTTANAIEALGRTVMETTVRALGPK